VQGKRRASPAGAMAAKLVLPKRGIVPIAQVRPERVEYEGGTLGSNKHSGPAPGGSPRQGNLKRSS
jgi:hypothetical protein